MTAMVGMESAGRLLGPAMGGLLAGRNVRFPFILDGILALAAILPSFRLVRESAPDKATSSAKKKESDLSTRAFLLTLLNREFIAFFAGQFFASMARGALWGGTLLLYVAYAYHAGPELLGILSTATGIVGIPITLCAGYVMDRFGRKTTIVPGFALTAAGLVFMALTAQWQLSLGMFVLAFLLVHGAQSITSGNMQVLGADIAPAAARGRFFGIWRAIGEVGHILSPALFAVLAEQVSYSASFYFLGVCAFAAAGVVGFQVRETVGREKR